MDNNTVTELLKNYRSYKYAVINCGRVEWDTSVFSKQTVYTQRFRSNNPDAWDRDRYHRIVNMIEGAVDYVLSDDQKIIIQKKYLDRNTMTISEISDYLKRDRSTISLWHKAAINKLATALEPLTSDEREITNFDHMFEKGWTFKEPA